MIDFEKLAADMGDLKETEVLAAARLAAEHHPDAVTEVLAALSKGMDIIGERFDGFEYFVGDLIFAGEIFSTALELLRPAFPVAENSSQKKVILATVEGDLHDIGKNIVKAVLRSKGLKVVDLGVNVAPATIVQRTLEENARIVALSAVLSSALEAMKCTVDAFREAGVRDRISIVVGGACVNARTAKYVKADFFGETPEDTAAFCMAAEG